MTATALHSRASLLSWQQPFELWDAGGASFGYTLLIVILMANFIAIFLQALCIKLGAVSERDLAQACRDAYPR